MSKVKMMKDSLGLKKDFFVSKYDINGETVFTLYYKEFSYLRVYSNNLTINKDTFSPNKHRKVEKIKRFGSFVGARNYIFLELFYEEVENGNRNS